MQGAGDQALADGRLADLLGVVAQDRTDHGDHDAANDERQIRADKADQDQETAQATHDFTQAAFGFLYAQRCGDVPVVL